MVKKEEMLLYNCLRMKLDQKKDSFNRIKVKEVNWILGVDYHIKKEFRKRLIAELIEMNWISYINNGKTKYYLVL